MQNLKRTNVLGVGVSSLNMNEAVGTLLEARAKGQTGYVCVTGVHGVIESQRDSELKQIHNRSFLTVPDGMPTVWMGREQGFVHMGRVYGPDLMLRMMEETSGGGQVLGTGREALGGSKFKADSCKSTANCESNFLYPSQDETGALDLGEEPTADSGQLDESSLPNQSTTKNPSTEKMSCTHFLYGATEETLKELKINLETRFPGVQIVGTYAPPFRPLNEDEEEELREIIAACRPDFFWVGLSTPKQEKFMASHSRTNDIHELQQSALSGQRPDSVLRSPISDLCTHPLDAGIMLGVGAAFDIHAGHYKDSPEWIKNSGLQWLHRLCKEPRRLWRRYLDIVPAFLWLSAMQLLGVRKYSLED